MLHAGPQDTSCPRTRYNVGTWDTWDDHSRAPLESETQIVYMFELTPTEQCLLPCAQVPASNQEEAGPEGEITDRNWGLNEGSVFEGADYAKTQHL